MSTDENKAIVRRLFAVFNGDEEVSPDEVLGPNLVVHEPDDGINGVEGVAMLRAAFPDVRYMIEDDLVADGEKVAVRWTGRGTHQGELFGVAPTGKQMAWTGITIFRIAEGKVIEGWVNRDTLSLLHQLGTIPRSGQIES